MSKNIWLSFTFLLFLNYTHAQQDIEDVLAFHLLESLQDEESFAFYSERLKELMVHPLDLNHVTKESLSDLFFISPYQIQQFIEYRNFAGPFLSTLELQVIPGFTVETIQLMIPFVRVESISLNQRLSNMDWQSKNEGSFMSTYSRVLQTQKGYKVEDPNRSKYLGSADRFAIRLRMSLERDLKFTFNMEKDAGEPIFAYKQKLGFDHYSGSILLMPNNRIKKLIIGDYNLQFGQGLWLWTGTRYSAGGGVGQIVSNSNEIVPHTGMAESKFMRGIATNASFGKFTVTPFLASNKYSATVQQIEDNLFVRSINYSGLHRTKSEQEKRKSLTQWVGGTHIQFNDGTLKVGAGWYAMIFDNEIKPIVANSQINRFEGHKLESVSFNFQYHWNNMLWFGESAHSIHTGFAHNYGLIAGMGNKLSLSISLRDYHQDYYQFLAQSFQEQSNLGNERGYFMALDYHPTKWVTWSNSFDWMYIPGPRFRAKEPSQGLRFQSQFTYRWNKYGLSRIKYQLKTFEENFRADLKISEGLAEVQRHQIKITNQHKLNETWTLANGFEYKHFQKNAEDNAQGFLIYQDLLWKNLWDKLHGNIRFSYFDTSNYDSRIYTYERDVLHAFSFPAYYRKGIRFYVNHRVRINRNFDVWGKFGWSNYFNEDTLGSGLDTIEGSHKSEIKFQLRYSW